MNSSKRSLVGRLVFMFILTLVAVVPTVGVAATFTVNSTADAVAANPAGGVCQTAPGNGICTLRAAIQTANATPLADTIVLPPGTYVLSIAGAGENLAATGDLDISLLGNSLTITGAGAATTIIDGNAIDRVFETTLNGTNATISGVTIRNGSSNDGLGGCISIGGNTTMALNNAVVTACTALGANAGGGGIDVTGTLTMTNVAVTNNTSTSGGIDNGAAGTITWTNGTLSGNSDRGINNSGRLTLTNVTISGNSTLGDGAGLDNDGPLATLTNCTVVGNTAPVNAPATNIGGIRATTAVSVTNTIIANNTPTNCGAGGAATPLTSLGNNLDSGATCLTVVAAGDLRNTDPLLGALALNGGALQTIALLAGSPAIDSGSAAACPATDARGIARPVDGNPAPPAVSAICDMGAFEFRPQQITVTPASPSVFGPVQTNAADDHVITLSNAGDGALVIGALAVTDPLAVPFSIPVAVDACSGKTLPLAGTCTFTVHFAPVAAGAASDTFNIPSNDPLTPAVSFAVSGTGSAVPVPGIEVTDTILPANDNLVPFGSVTVGSSADATITVTNTGTANLIIGTIAGANPLAPPFTLLNNTCSGQIIAPAATCALTVHFAPTVNGPASETFDIPSTGLPTVTMTVNGTGGPATPPPGTPPPGTPVVVNNPPTNPVLISPTNGQTGVPTTMTFSWKKSLDPDNDAITYHFSYSTDQNFTTPQTVDVAGAKSAGLLFAGLGSLGGGIIMIGFVAGTGSRRSRITTLGIIALILIGTLFTACGGGGGSSTPVTTPPPTDQVSTTVTGLAANTTYFWKVVADDGKGGLASSETFSFTTQ